MYAIFQLIAYLLVLTHRQTPNTQIHFPRAQFHLVPKNHPWKHTKLHCKGELFSGGQTYHPVTVKENHIGPAVT